VPTWVVDGERFFEEHRVEVLADTVRRRAASGSPVRGKSPGVALVAGLVSRLPVTKCLTEADSVC
jgi:hypothetical protein